MITFQIQIPADATKKQVANAIAIRTQLMEAGIAEGMIADAPSVMRSASPSFASGEKGPHEKAWQTKYKRGFRTSPQLVAAFQARKLLAATFTKEELIALQESLLASKQLVKTVTGYAFTDSGSVSGKREEIAVPKGEEIDPDEVV